MAIRTMLRGKRVLLLTLAAMLVAVPAAQARSSHVTSAVGGTITTSGNRWYLNNTPFIPIVTYDPFENDDCIPDTHVSTLLATGAVVALVNHLTRKKSVCGSTQTEQIQTIHESLAGQQLAWNYGPDQPVLTRDPSISAEDEVVNFPMTHDIGDPASTSPQPGTASLIDHGITAFNVCRRRWTAPEPMSVQLVPVLKNVLSSGPALVDIYISGASWNCTTPAKEATQFWTAAAMGAGISYSLIGKSKFLNLNAKLMTEAGKLSGQLATLTPVLLDGQPLKLAQPRGFPIPARVTRNGTYPVVKEEPQSPVRYVFGWQYESKVYILVVSEGFISDGLLVKQWTTRTHGKWVDHRWHWPRVSLKLKGLKHMKVQGLFGAKGLKVTNGRASIKMGALGAKWFVLTPKT